jgi:hypothetical protein
VQRRRRSAVAKTVSQIMCGAAARRKSITTDL